MSFMVLSFATQPPGFITGLLLMEIGLTFAAGGHIRSDPDPVLRALLYAVDLTPLYVLRRPCSVWFSRCFTCSAGFSCWFSMLFDTVLLLFCLRRFVLFVGDGAR